jgi:malate dehydrogenase (oxaloacetate-decarboxylating)
MLLAASQALASLSPLATTGQGSLLPALGDIQKVSKVIAAEVARVAQREGVASVVSEETLQSRLDSEFWQATYRPYKLSSF